MAAGLLCGGAIAQEAPVPAPAPASAASTLPSVVVSGSVAERRLEDAPYAASVIDADTLRAAGPRVNLSEALNRVPGLTANNRQNYAQDLQLSSRGFGARAPFGVRGLRLYTDGIPATMPDGQGQVTHFDLASAARIEILRGPFTALYGNSSGGVIALVTAPVRERFAQLDLDTGSAGLRQARFSAGTPFGPRDAAGRGPRRSSAPPTWRSMARARTAPRAARWSTGGWPGPARAIRSSCCSATSTSARRIRSA